MFDIIKQFKQFKELKDTLSKEKVEVERNGIKVVLNGLMEIEEIYINAPLEKQKLEQDIKNCINEAIRKIQMNLTFKMKGIMK